MSEESAPGAFSFGVWLWSAGWVLAGIGIYTQLRRAGTDGSRRAGVAEKIRHTLVRNGIDCIRQGLRSDHYGIAV